MQTWLRALKPNSWSKLLVPFLLGQGLGYAAAAEFRLAGFVAGLAFTWFGMAFIVLINDWADQQVDRLKRRMFPTGCSEKTIPDGHLRSGSVGAAGAIAAVMALASAVAYGLATDSHALMVFAAANMLLFAAYSLPPLRVNYRGGGELLEALGVGVTLPALNAAFQAPHVLGGAWWWPSCWDPLLRDVAAGFFLVAFAGAVASGLSDEESDRKGGKRTLTVLLGNRAACLLTVASLGLGGTVWLAIGVLSPAVSALHLAAAGVVVLGHVPKLVQLQRQAITNAFAAQANLKAWLRRVVARATLVLLVALLLATFL